VSRPRAGRAGLAVALAALAMTAAACGGGRPAASRTTAGGTLTVFAAASLTEAFTAMAHQFEQAHPGTKVVLSFGPSSGLAEQIVQGAPADVFASASSTNMQRVVGAGLAGSPPDFATNVMEIAVPPGNPGRVTGVRDLARSGVKVAVCQPQVPCGAVAAKVFANAGVTVRAVTQEADVKAVLSKVGLGEVDAGVVYLTDVRAAGDSVRGVLIPPSLNASTSYPIAVLSGAPNPPTARTFVDFVVSDAGRSALADAGFQAP
jgi:molybdate transport system substrate-binding protein